MATLSPAAQHILLETEAMQSVFRMMGEQCWSRCIPGVKDIALTAEEGLCTDNCCDKFMEVAKVITEQTLMISQADHLSKSRWMNGAILSIGVLGVLGAVVWAVAGVDDDDMDVAAEMRKAELAQQKNVDNYRLD